MALGLPTFIVGSLALGLTLVASWLIIIVALTVVVLAFAALDIYLFAGTASVATGGQAVPLGKPNLHN